MAAAHIQTAEGSAMVNEDSIIDRILEAHGHVAPPPGAFTVRDYCERARARGVIISEAHALKTLRDEIEAGRLHGRKINSGGRERYWFW